MTVLRNVQVKCLKELIVISLYLFFCHNLSIFYHKENGFVCAVLFILGRQMFVGLTVFKCNLKHIHTMMYNIFLIYDTQTTFLVLFYLTHNSPVLSYKNGSVISYTKQFCFIIHKKVQLYQKQNSLVISKTNSSVLLLRKKVLLYPTYNSSVLSYRKQVCYILHKKFCLIMHNISFIFYTKQFYFVIHKLPVLCYTKQFCFVIHNNVLFYPIQNSFVLSYTNKLYFIIHKRHYSILHKITLFYPTQSSSIISYTMFQRCIIRNN